MEVKVLTKQEIYNDVAKLIVNLVKSKPNAVLGLATGGTMEGVYEALVKEFDAGNISFKQTKSFNLDEYYPIDNTNSQSYHYYMNRNLFNSVDIDKDNTHFPSIDNFQYYDQLIAAAGGIDFQLLGLGSNGHIAFNEPGTDFSTLTHVVKLADSTIKDNARFFNDRIEDVPTHAISMGLESIMNAKQIVLIATGQNKAYAIKQLIEGETNTSLPASVLKTHPNVVIYLDKDAASGLC